jgi:hypothetical protein
MKWPIYTESESDFIAELKWLDNSNCTLQGDRPSIFRDRYYGEGPPLPAPSLTAEER